MHAHTHHARIHSHTDIHTCTHHTRTTYINTTLTRVCPHTCRHAHMHTTQCHIPYTPHTYAHTRNTPDTLYIHHTCHHHRPYHSPTLHAHTSSHTHHTHTYAHSSHTSHSQRHTPPHPLRRSFTWAGAWREHRLLADLELRHLRLIPFPSFFCLEWLETWEVFPEKKMKTLIFPAAAAPPGGGCILTDARL